MTTGGGATVSVAVAVTVGGQEIPCSDWLKGAGCRRCPPQQEVRIPNLRGLPVRSAQGQRASAGGSMSPANLKEEEPVSISSLVLSGIFKKGNLAIRVSFLAGSLFCSLTFILLMLPSKS